MQELVIVMAIMGCSDGGVGCRQLETVERSWATLEQCQSELERHLVRVSDADFPVIVARCARQAEGPPMVAGLQPLS